MIPDRRKVVIFDSFSVPPDAIQMLAVEDREPFRGVRGEVPTRESGQHHLGYAGQIAVACSTQHGALLW